MIRQLIFPASLILSLLLMPGPIWADTTCEEGIQHLDYGRFLAPDAQCAANKQEFCAYLGNMDMTEYAKLLTKVKKETDPSTLENREMKTADAFAACGLDFDAMHYRQCQKAYRREDLNFVIAYCPGEAWSLARAQCERQPDTVSPRYVKFCNLFYSGKAPGPGERPAEY
jgi:hypothetical protein